jgi:lipopolysaccharide export system permease protein
MLFAEDYNLATGTMRGATIISYGDEKKPTLWLYANVLEYDPKRGIENGWRIRDGATLTWRNGSTIALRDEAWPVGVAAPGPPTGSVASDQIKDPQYWSMRELREQIALAREEGRTSLGRIRDMEYWFWNKLALPLAAFVYGLLGGPLGIRNHRTSTATGFATSIVIIFGYVTVANLMNVYAMGGVIPAYVASFTPIVIGLTAAALAIWRRNL